MADFIAGESNQRPALVWELLQSRSGTMEDESPVSLKVKTLYLVEREVYPPVYTALHCPEQFCSVLHSTHSTLTRPVSSGHPEHGSTTTTRSSVVGPSRGKR